MREPVQWYTPISKQVTALSMRLSTVMKRLGWERTTNGKVTIQGKQVRGYFRWKKAWPILSK
jgi:hypothetical protein